MKSQVVIFDVGGTLSKTPDLFTAIAENLTGKQSDDKVRDLAFKVFINLYQNTVKSDQFQTMEDMITGTLGILAKDYGYPVTSNRARDIYFDVFLHKSSLFPEIPYLLDTLYKNDTSMIVASDADIVLTKEFLVKHKIDKYFVDICTSDLVEAYKPADKFVRYLTRYTSDNEENSYFVGDNRVDIESGEKLCIKSVLIDRRNREDKMGADYVIHDLKELLPILSLK
jgi:phosphoglycolate phosphatase-like HAD superfamily hydrolase